MPKYCKIFSKSLALFILQFTFATAYCQNSASTMGFNGNSSSLGESADVFGLGLTYGGGLGAPFISYDLLPNYSGSTSIGAIATYEHLFTKKIGLGLAFSYSNASYSALINYPSGVSYPGGTLTDTKKGEYMSIAGRCIYHFSGFHRFDPYIGAISGITLTNLNSNTYTAGSESAVTNQMLFGGVLIGVLAGVGYNLSNYISIKLEVNYSGVPNYLGGLSVTYKIYDRY